MKEKLSLKQFRVDLARAVFRDRVVYLIVLLVSLSAISINHQLNPDYGVNLFLYGNTIIRANYMLAVCWIIGYFIFLAMNRHPSPLRAYQERLMELLARPDEIAAFLLLLCAIIIFKSAFTALKALIPSLKPFVYDVLLTDLDRAIHFGVDPWKITHGLFSSPMATGFINFLYKIWFVVYWVTLMYFLVRVKDVRIRLQYVVSFLLCWVLIGNVLATLISAAGPCFYGLIVEGSDVFLPLMEKLRLDNAWLSESGQWMSVWALDTQALLWHYYVTDTTGLGNGISAMPSMHVSMAVLMALGIGRISRRWAILFWIYAVFIQIGSVHLGWHYALDGYVSTLLTLTIWKMVAYFYRLESAQEPIVQSSRSAPIFVPDTGLASNRRA